MLTTPTDEELLTSDHPEAFGVFYARHYREVETYFTRRVGSDAAADLAAETFASALVARRRFMPGPTPAAGWLYAIAARRLVDYRRRRLVRARTLEALASDVAVRQQAAPPPEIAAELDAGLLRHLPPDQRDAIVAHVLDERDYRQLASEFSASEASVRQRVSRGLTALRRPLQVYRSARELARQDRTYRLGGGHSKDLRSLGPREPLDCSSSASLILLQSGLFEPGPAWDSSRIADAWGRPGEGDYVTVWANEEHVWIEFKFELDHGERFDPTPSRLAPNNAWLRSKPRPIRDFVPRHCPGL